MWKNTFVVAALGGALSGCGGGGSSGDAGPPPSAMQRIEGTVSGLVEGAVTLRDSFGEEITVANNGRFAFQASLPSGTHYSVWIVQSPMGQRCRISGPQSADFVAGQGPLAIECNAILSTFEVRTTGSEAARQLIASSGGQVTVGFPGTYRVPQSVPLGSTYTLTLVPELPSSCTATGLSGVAQAETVLVSLHCAEPVTSSGQSGGANPSGTQPGGAGAAGSNNPAVTINGLTAQSVELANSDGTRIAGYRYAAAVPQRNAAVVLLHGCGGMWTGAVQAASLHPIHDLAEVYRRWATQLAQAGYVALLVDSFSPRGIRSECGNGTAGLNEAVVRPRDALAGQRHLVATGIPSRRIALMGWSNGASAALATMDRTNEGGPASRPFLEAFVFYPGCGLLGEFGGARSSTWLPYAPVSIYHGDADDLWRDGNCTRRVNTAAALGASAASGNAVSLIVYPGAEHSFDQVSNGAAGAAAAANRAARTEADAAIWNRLQAILP